LYRRALWAACALAVSMTAALAIPALAGATITTDIRNGELFVVGDAEDNTIALSVFGGSIAVNSAVTAEKADATAKVVVIGGAGDDVVDASALAAANYGELTLLGSEGDDHLTGGAGNDFVAGETGDDRLLGGKGKDTLRGEEGDDVLVWNNGDGSDFDTGEEGSDEVQVNGDPDAGDEIFFGPLGEPGTAHLERSNLKGFEIDLEAERLTIAGLGGDDRIEPDPLNPTGMAGQTALTIDGGAGEDQLTGGDGADRILGGAGSDGVFGGPGDDILSGGDAGDFLDGEDGADRLFGDHGSDAMAGGPGDDVFVWNNGDGSDEEAGEDGFDTAEVNGSPAAGDAFTLGLEDGAPVFHRTNLVPFRIDFSLAAAITEAGVESGVEAVAVDGLGGNDAFAVSPGLPEMLVAAEGGAGDDRLTGAEEADSFFGGPGNDLLVPGGGSDLADGGEGNDRIESRDGRGDLVRGGTGTDSAVTDALTVDAVDGVESVDAPPAPTPATTPPAVNPDRHASLPALGRLTVGGRSGKQSVKVPLSCPADESGGCITTVTVETARPVRLGHLRAAVVLGAGRTVLAPGERGTATVRLAAGAAALARHGHLQARLRLESSDAAGNSASRSVKVSLRLTRG
jgi:Ca2+-binding RTX toxin-like protein